MSIEDIKNLILSRTRETIRENFGHSELAEKLVLTFPPDVSFGDFALECFPLAKEFKKPPAEIAEELALKIKPSEIIKNIQADGPYLNFKISKDFLFKEVLREIFEKGENFGNSEIGKNSLFLLEYLSPNTNKPLHLGHIRNGVLAMAISNLLEAQGYKIIKANLVNDRGIHICQSTLAWQKWGGGETPRSSGVKGDHFVGRFYVRYHSEAGKSPEIKEQLEKETRQMLQKWEAGDKEIIELWQTMNQWVEQGFEETYKELGLKFDVFDYESETYKLGKKIVEIGIQKGVFKKTEDGAFIAELTNGQKITLIRSDGTSVYITQDLGAAKLRIERHRPDRLIYVSAVEQDFHFKTLFEILEMVGFQWAKKLNHLSYGLVNLPEGKMKSREGKVVDADDLISAIKDLALEEILKRHSDLEKSEALERAKKIGLAAIKFYLLRVKPVQEINFNPKESISFDGFTGPYCQYAYGRAANILKKANKEVGAEIDFSVLNKKEELILFRHLIQFPEKIRLAAKEFNPAAISEYLFETAKAFNHFYTFCPVLAGETENLIEARLALVRAASIILKKSLNLLGIEALKAM